MLLTLRAAGIDLPVVAKRLGIPPDMLLDRDARLPVARLMLPLWELAAELLDDPVVALRATQHISRESFDVFSYVVAASPTVGDAATRVIRYFRLITDGGAYSLDREGQHVWWRFTPADAAAAACQQDTVFALAVVVKHLRLWTDPAFTPLEVRIRHSELAGLLELEDYFRVPITLGADRNAFRFEASLLDRPSHLADAGLAELLDRYANEALAALPALGLIGSQVRELLARGLQDGEVALDSVAKRLGMSERSLQRSLKDENTSLKQMVDELRQELATHYLRRPDLSISDVAYMLGFSEAAPFCRAFKRWTGRAPGEYRRQNGGAETANR